MPATSRAHSAAAARPHEPDGSPSDRPPPNAAPTGYGHAASTGGHDDEAAERVSGRPSQQARVPDWPYAPPRRSAATARPKQADVAPLPSITATGGAIVSVTASSLAAILDALLSPGLGVLFGFVFVLSSVLVALRMCWYDAWSALALPPLVFIVAAGIAAQIAPVSSGSWLHRTSTDMAIAVLDHPLPLLAGTLFAALAIIHRARVE